MLVVLVVSREFNLTYKGSEERICGGKFCFTRRPEGRPWLDVW